MRDLPDERLRAAQVLYCLRSRELNLSEVCHERIALGRRSLQLGANPVAFARNGLFLCFFPLLRRSRPIPLRDRRIPFRPHRISLCLKCREPREPGIALAERLIALLEWTPDQRQPPMQSKRQHHVPMLCNDRGWGRRLSPPKPAWPASRADRAFRRWPPNPPAPPYSPRRPVPGRDRDGTP